jgi:fluoride ion exporter CrcB/FEX
MSRPAAAPEKDASRVHGDRPRIHRDSSRIHGGLGVILLAAVPWRPVAMASIAALSVLSLVAVWPNSAFSGVGIGLTLACLAAAASFLLDEPAAAAVDSVPKTLRARTSVRLVGLILPVSIGGLGLLVIGERLDSTPHRGLPYSGLLLLMAGCLLLGVASASCARRFSPAPGDLVSGIVAGLLATLVVYNPVSRWVDVFPLSPHDRWSRAVILWAVICLACLVSLARTTRDPLK